MSFFYIKKKSLNQILQDEFNLKNDFVKKFIKSLQKYIFILNSTDINLEKLNNHFHELVKDLNFKSDKNKIPLISVEGCIGVGKSTFLEDFKKDLDSRFIFIAEPLRIWKCIILENNKDIFDAYYESIENKKLNRMTKFNLSFYFQLTVIYTRWLIFIFTVNQYRDSDFSFCTSVAIESVVN